MMNERIKELYEQAHLVYEIPYESSVVDSTIVSTYKRRQFDAEKFAELIVLEMCNVLDKAQWDKGEDWVCADGTRIIPQVKEHFGVEE